MNISTSRGFTLIELLVVIAILGILSSVVLASMQGARARAQYAAANVEMRSVLTVVHEARFRTGDYLKDVTGTGWSEGQCMGDNLVNTQEMSTTHQCYIRMRESWRRIGLAAGLDPDFMDEVMRDPWGGVYTIDENEHEFAYDPCRLDIIRSPGPDGFIGGGDDVVYRVDFLSSCS